MGLHTQDGSALAPLCSESLGWSVRVSPETAERWPHTVDLGATLSSTVTKVIGPKSGVSDMVLRGLERHGVSPASATGPQRLLAYR